MKTFGKILTLLAASPFILISFMTMLIRFGWEIGIDLFSDLIDSLAPKADWVEEVERIKKEREKENED